MSLLRRQCKRTKCSEKTNLLSCWRRPSLARSVMLAARRRRRCLRRRRRRKRRQEIAGGPGWRAGPGRAGPGFHRRSAGNRMSRLCFGDYTHRSPSLFLVLFISLLAGGASGKPAPRMRADDFPRRVATVCARADRLQRRMSRGSCRQALRVVVVLPSWGQLSP